MSPLALRWTERAEKDFRRLNSANQRRVAGVISRFAETGEGEVKRLQGPLGAEYRLRAGDIRVRFAVASDASIVILRVLPRDKAYR